MRPPRRVVHVIGTLDIGGAELRALDLCRAIPAEDVVQTFICLAGRKGELAAEFEELGAEVLPIAMGIRPRFFIALFQTFRRIKPDAVVSHVSLASGAILMVAWAAGIGRRIARIHSTGDGKSNSITRRIYRSLASTMLAISATSVVGVSQSAIDFGEAHGPLRRLTRRKSFVLPNGVDLNIFELPVGPASRADSNHIPTVVYVGRASPEKNRGLLVPILSALRDIRPFRMLIVGPGGSDDLGELLPEEMELLGARNDVHTIMQGADVLVLTSVREGLPSVILEALASGLPVVASDLPTIRELANTIDGITVVGLDEPPSAWASALNTSASQDVDNAMRIRRSLESSSFAMPVNAKMWQQIWGTA